MGAMNVREKRHNFTLGTFDFIKGLGMIHIVIAHSVGVINSSGMGSINPVVTAVINFTGYALMGMYFIISGIGLREAPVMKFAKQMAKKILVPYMYSLLAIILIFPIVDLILYRMPTSTLHELIKIILTFFAGVFYYGKHIAGFSLTDIAIFWYLLALFWSLFILNAILKIKKKNKQLFIILLVYILGIILEERQLDYLCICKGFLALPIVFLGYCIKKEEIFATVSRGKYVSLLVLFATVPPLLDTIGKLEECYYIAPWLELISKCTFGMLCVFVSELTDGWQSNIVSGIRQIGKYSLWVMCIHGVGMRCIPWNELIQFFPKHLNMCLGVIIVARSILIFVGCKLLKKYGRKFTKLFRRSRK